LLKKKLFSRITEEGLTEELPRRTLKIPLIDFKCRKYAVLNFLGKITSLDIFVQISVDHPLNEICVILGGRNNQNDAPVKPNADFYDKMKEFGIPKLIGLTTGGLCFITMIAAFVQYKIREAEKAVEKRLQSQKPSRNVSR
jgi:hypothetical protein